jgi:hypothetical protein
METTPVSNSDEQLLSVLATLEECRAVLQDGGSRDTAQLISVAILELRMKLNRIGDEELKALCEAMLPEEARTDRSGNTKPDAKPPAGQRRRPLLRLVK